MTSLNSLEDYFEKASTQWYEMRSSHFTEAVRGVAICKAYLHPEMVVADVGSGTGFIAEGLSPLVNQVHLIDSSPAMIELVKKNLVHLKNLEYHVADGLALPIPESSLDAVFANMYLHHCPDPLAAIREMVSVLRPGGRLVITDMDIHPYEWLKTGMADFWLGFDRAQIREWFQTAGLVNLVIDDTGQKYQSDFRSETGERADIEIFIAVGTKKISAHDSVQNRYAAEATGSGCGCGDSSCCSPGTVTLDEIGSVDWDGGYTSSEKAEVPAEAAEISLGCGNPIAMAGLKPGETVLDIGSGGGIDVFLAARRVGPTGFVYGIDMTAAMLQRARKAAKKGGFTNVLFRHGFAEKLPVKDGIIDVVISNCVINLSEDKGKVFEETFRVLKPGGRLEVNDTVFGGPVKPEVRLSVAGWSECISGALPEQEYVDLVRLAGFAEVTVRRSTSSGTACGVPFYSVQVSARKPG